MYLVPLACLLSTNSAYIPMHIIQTSRSGKSAYKDSWRRCYADVRYTCFNDSQVYDEIRDTRWQGVWSRLTGVQQADVFRYYYMYHHGGIYADTDVECTRPMPANILSRYNLVIGLESFITDHKLAAHVQMVVGGQYVQWTIAAAPKHPVLKDVLDSIYASVPARADHGIDFTLGFTGPYAWTHAVRRHLMDPDLHVLPQVAFACNGYSSSDCTGSEYVRHHWDGSWRTGL